MVRATPPLSAERKAQYGRVGAGQASRPFAYAGKEGRRGRSFNAIIHGTACLCG